jgi:hypothetical protein
MFLIPYKITSWCAATRSSPIFPVRYLQYIFVW